MNKLNLVLLMHLLLFFGCSKDDKIGAFDYDINLLYGKWRITHVEQNDGTYLNVSSTLAEQYFKPTYATFNSNGSYSGSGEFGSGLGIYKAEGKTITTYINGQEYLLYDVLMLSGTNAELKMYEKGSSASVKIKVVKQ